MDQNLFGYFCWHECFTKDVDRARSFYSELLGWKHQELSMGEDHYTMLKATEDDADFFGGLVTETTPSIGSHWLSYVAVDDLEAKLARSIELGGKTIMPVTPIPGHGHFATVQDPTGATIALFRGNQPQPMRTPEQMKPGLPCWMELLSTDPAKSIAFFTALLGWQSTSKDLPDGQTYTMLMNGAHGVGGVMKTPAREVPSHWYPYFLTNDLASSYRRAKTLGGGECMPPTEIGEGMGSFSIQMDPLGAVFGFYAMPKNAAGKDC